MMQSRGVRYFKVPNFQRFGVSGILHYCHNKPVPCDFIKQDELQKPLSVHHDVLARPLEESTDWMAPSRVQRFDGQTLALPQRS